MLDLGIAPPRREQLEEQDEEPRLVVDQVQEAGDEHVEDVMLRVRLRQGLSLDRLDGEERTRARELCRSGLLVERADALVLTDRGRLLADAVVRDLLP